MPLGVSATYVILFIIFGTFWKNQGPASSLWISLRAVRDGPGEDRENFVYSSALFRTISGSAVANVMVDGRLTIPLMKRTGFKPPFACAVEATASTGAIMPPVMGAAALSCPNSPGSPILRSAFMR